MTPSGSLLRKSVIAFSHAMSLVGMGAMGLMVLHITLDVAARYLTGRPLPGTIAFVANYYMVAVTFLPLVVAERERKHIEVEVLAQKLPPRVRSVLRLACWMVTAAVFLLLGWQSAIEAGRAWRNGMFMLEQSVRIDIWISYFMLPVGFFSAAAVALSRSLIALPGAGEGVVGAVARAEGYFAEGEHRD
jgi:TRAP-type C4-dicarboxylate transport system permease small subunit